MESSISTVRNGYTFVRKIGSGASAVVWLVTMNDKEYACKEIGISMPGYKFYSYREIDIVSSISHPNLISYISIFFDSSVNPGFDRSAFFVLPLGKEDLGSILASIDSVPSEETKLRYIYEILSAISILHKARIYHCDIKPDNILIKDDHAILADLGSAYYDDGIKDDCLSLGYSPPEKVKLYFNKSITNTIKRSWSYQAMEIWGLGVLIMFITKTVYTNRYAPWMDVGGGFQSNFESFLKDEVGYFDRFGIDKRYHPLLLRMLDPDPETRIKSVDEVLLFDIFKDNSYDKAIPGVIHNNININNEITCSPYYDVLIDWMKDALVAYECLAVTYFSAVDLLYRCILKIWDGNMRTLQTLGASVLFISTNLFEDLPIHIDNLYEATDGGSARRDIFDGSLNIVLKLNGILRYNTMYDYAFSQQSLKQAYKLTLNCDTYRKIDPKSYMISLESQETSEQREERKSKYLISLKDLI